MGEPIPSKWLGEGFYRLVDEQPDLKQAYDYPNYEGRPEGNGHWVDLFFDQDHRTPIGRLWRNEDGGCGIEQLPACNTDLFTREALQLRLYRREGFTSEAAFVEVLTRYPHNPINADDLSDAITITDTNEE
jgi:hypothetical protein